jgi:dihydrolipoamide dehydrogenase
MKDKVKIQNSSRIYYVPELGKREDKAEVVEILTQAGEKFIPDQELMILTTDKASFSLEATEAGRTLNIRVKPGDLVASGDPLLEYEPSTAPLK